MLAKTKATQHTLFCLGVMVGFFKRAFPPVHALGWGGSIYRGRGETFPL